MKPSEYVVSRAVNCIHMIIRNDGFDEFQRSEKKLERQNQRYVKYWNMKHEYVKHEEHVGPFGMGVTREHCNHDCERIKGVRKGVRKKKV
jgi:hypothetical protein